MLDLLHLSWLHIYFLCACTFKNLCALLMWYFWYCYSYDKFCPFYKSVWMMRNIIHFNTLANQVNFPLPSYTLQHLLCGLFDYSLELAIHVSEFAIQFFLGNVPCMGYFLSIGFCWRWFDGDSDENFILESPNISK